MTIRLAVDALMVRVELHTSGDLVLQPMNPAAAIAFLHLSNSAPVTLQPGSVEQVLDMEPDDDGICDGWVDIVTTGHTFRVPYRRRQAPYVRELMRVMAQEHGYPVRQSVGKRVREDERPIEVRRQEALL